MKQFYFYLLWLVTAVPVWGQKTWSGYGGDQQWDNPDNWSPAGIPGTADDILLNNNFQSSDYTVLLPSGNITVTVNSLVIAPEGGKTIMLVLPSGNTAAPGLVVNGTGNAFIIGEGGIFKNSSGASSGDAVNITGLLCILNGGRYIHNTARGNAQIIDRLSVEENTAKGIFEFDVPGSAGYTVSLTGNTFGSLYFSASAGNKSYSGNGTSTLKIRGDLQIGSGATVTSTLTSDIHLYGNLTIEGTLNLNPNISGTNNRNLMLFGSPAFIKGNGIFLMNAHFRAIMLASGAEYFLERSIHLPNSGNGMTILQGAKFHPAGNAVSGEGRFTLEAGSDIFLEKTNGISDNVLTAQNTFSQEANYHFIADHDQYTGNKFPDEIAHLELNKPDGQLILSKNLLLTGNLRLLNGRLKTSQGAVLTLSGTVESEADQYGQINGGQVNSFIDGPVQIAVNAGNQVTVPVGKDELFAPVTLFKTSPGSGNYLVEYMPQPYGIQSVQNGLLHHVSKKEYWKITSDANASGDEVELSLSWRPYSAVSPDNMQRNDLRIAHYDGFNWKLAGNEANISGNESYGIIKSRTAVQNNSVFTIGSASPFNILPLYNLRFGVKPSNDVIQLAWTFESADSCEYIQPEKSRDGQSFKPMHKLLYTGTGLNHFIFADSFPYTGDNYYRIGIKLSNDSLVYSNVASVIYQRPEKIRLYPNPANDHINIFFSNKSSSLEYVIVNSYGSVINRKQKLKEDLTRIPLTGLPPGRYTLIIYKNKELIALPFLKYSIL